MLPSDHNITHLHLDTFFVSAERLQNPKLIGKLVIVGGASDSGVVSSCSYEARKFGVHAAMPMFQAKRLYSHAIFVKGDYEAYSNLVTEVISDKVPTLEKSSIDEFYIDLTKMDKFLSCSKFSSELKAKIMKESGPPISYAVASNKLISKVATNKVKPNGHLEIASGSERAYLAPLNITKLPSVGGKTKILLLNMGVQKVKTLANIPIELLTNLLGKNGAELHRRANGIDDSPVVPFHEQKSMSTEHTFQQDTIDLNFLNAELARMTEKLAFQLRCDNRLTGCISVKISYTDFETHNVQKTIPARNQDHIILKTVRELFTKLYTRRVLVRLIGIRFTNLLPGNYHISLFEDTQEKINLYQRIDSIKRQIGEGFILRASGL
jgi:DNA polymerase-4